MNGKYLLDTNIIIALFANDLAVKERLTRASDVFVPSIAVGELCFGARKSGRVEANLKRIDDFVAASSVLDCSAETARRYGEVKNTLRLKGHPIRENDIWIAAIGLEHGLTLVTRDTHFGEIERLIVEKWQSIG
jgi:tRNA(fMet)-specific endonuclease VapC